MKNLESKFNDFVNKNYQKGNAWMIYWTYHKEGYDCNIEKNVVAYKIEKHEWCDDGGGIEYRYIVGVYRDDKNWKDVELEPWRHRTNARYDNDANYVEEVKVLEADEVQALIEVKKKYSSEKITFKFERG